MQNEALGQSTPTGPQCSTRASSTYNSRRTSLDNSGGSDIVNAALANASDKAAILNHNPGTSSLNTIKSESNIQKLSKQNSLEKPQIAHSAGSADSITANMSHRHGGLTQSSIADLEKKLAALRHAEILDEVNRVLQYYLLSIKVIQAPSELPQLQLHILAVA